MYQRLRWNHKDYFHYDLFDFTNILLKCLVFSNNFTLLASAKISVINTPTSNLGTPE